MRIKDEKTFKKEMAAFQIRVGKNIKKYRQTKGWTQFDMTEFKFSLRQFQYIEAGERNISLKTILRLAEAFAIEPYELIK